MRRSFFYPSTFRWVTIAIVTLTLVSCEEKPPRSESTRKAAGEPVDRPFNAPVVETAADAVDRVPEWRIGSTPITSIAGSETDDNYLFYNTQFIARLSDGRILVAPAGEELRFFDASGKYLYTRGRKGEGPGEFAQINELAILPGDTIATLDRSRVSFFDPKGNFLNSYNLAVRLGGRSHVAITASGIVTGAERTRQIADAVGIVQEQFQLIAFDRKGAPRDTLGILDGMWMNLNGSGGTSLAFTGAAQVTGSGNRVFVTEGESYEIRVFENAKPVHLIRNLMPRYPVTQADRDEIVKGRTPAANPQQAEARRERAKNARDQHPSITTLIADRAGNVWALHEPPERIGPAWWHVYGPDGRLIARMKRPRDQGIVREIGEDYIVITKQQDLALTRIEVLPLVKN
jgi:hypothetical protein